LAACSRNAGVVSAKSLVTGYWFYWFYWRLAIGDGRRATGDGRRAITLPVLQFVCEVSAPEVAECE